jgi:urease accessory protein
MAAVATSPGFLRLQFVRRPAQTILLSQVYSWPYTIGRRFYLDPGRPTVTVIVQSVSGTINSGDTLAQTIGVGPGARARLLGQGAVSVHRALDGRQASEEVDLVVDDGGHLEHLPEPRILFPGSMFEQRLRIEVGAGATVLATDGFVVHPNPDGRIFRRYRALVEIVTGAEVVASERLDLDAATFAPEQRLGYLAHGVVVLARTGVDWEAVVSAEQRCPELAVEPGLYHAVSCLPNGAGMVARIAAADGRLLRTGIARCIEVLRRSIPAG